VTPESNVIRGSAAVTGARGVSAKFESMTVGSGLGMFMVGPGAGDWASKSLVSQQERSKDVTNFHRTTATPLDFLRFEPIQTTKKISFN